MSLVLVTKSTSAPSNPYDGQVWVDTTGTPKIKVYDAGGSAWIPVSADAQLDDITGVLANLDTTAKGTLVAAINEVNAKVSALEVSGYVTEAPDLGINGVHVLIGPGGGTDCAATVDAPEPGSHVIVLNGNTETHTVTTPNGAPFMGFGAGQTTGKLVATFGGAVTDKLEIVYGLGGKWQVITADGITFGTDPV